MTAGGAIAQAARGCIGVPFRPQGRDRARGLDCIGVVAEAYRGHLRGAIPATYAQRGGNAATIGAALVRAGFRPIAVDEAGEGDLLLLSTGPGQWHFAVRTDDGFVHADARLRRVVETPGRPLWPIAGAWRIEGES